MVFWLYSDCHPVVKQHCCHMTVISLSPYLCSFDVQTALAASAKPGHCDLACCSDLAIVPWPADASLIILLLFIVKKSVLKALREHFCLRGRNIKHLVKPVSKVRNPVTEVSATTAESWHLHVSQLYFTRENIGVFRVLPNCDNNKLPAFLSCKEYELCFSGLFCHHLPSLCN